MQGWIGVDLDGTLAEHYWGRDTGRKFDPAVIGKPIAKMVEKVKKALESGMKVKIFTARIYYPPQPVSIHDMQAVEEYVRRRNEAESARAAINQFTYEQFGEVLEVTCTKDYGMYECWDDRSKQVVMNTGEFLEDIAWALSTELAELKQNIDAEPAPSADSHVVSTTEECCESSVISKAGAGRAEGAGEVAAGTSGAGNGDPVTAEASGDHRED